MEVSSSSTFVLQESLIVVITLVVHATSMKYHDLLIWAKRDVVSFFRISAIGS